jgi:hypothetical protein
MVCVRPFFFQTCSAASGVALLVTVVTGEKKTTIASTWPRSPHCCTEKKLCIIVYLSNCHASSKFVLFLFFSFFFLVDLQLRISRIEEKLMELVLQETGTGKETKTLGCLMDKLYHLCRLKSPDVFEIIKNHPHLIWSGKERRMGYTIMMMAIVCDWLHLADYLVCIILAHDRFSELEKKSTLQNIFTARNTEGCTPIHLSAYNMNAIVFVVEHVPWKTLMSVKDNVGWLLIHFVCICSRYACLERLRFILRNVSASASEILALKSNNGLTCSELANRITSQPSIEDLLLKQSSPLLSNSGSTCFKKCTHP